MKHYHRYQSRKARKIWLRPGRFTTGMIVGIAVSLVLFMVWVVFIYGKSNFDQWVFESLYDRTSFFWTRVMLGITFLGNHKFLIPANLVLMLYLLLKKDKWLAYRVLTIALSSLGLKLLLKNAFLRVRPDHPLIEGGVGGWSFPSGHALMSVAFYGLLAWLSAIFIKNKWWQYLCIAVCVLLILLISFSRIYLRVHFTTDIIAGLALGFAWLLFCLSVVERIELRYYEKKFPATDPAKLPQGL